MFILRPSSAFRVIEPRRETTIPASVTAETAAASAAAEPFIDEGLPIPEAYEVDIIRAMPQDPFRIFIYWEVREESLKALTRYFSLEEAAKFRITLRLTEIVGGHEAFFEVGRRGRYWMMVFPERKYEFEIGVRSPQHGYIPLVHSNRVTTPRGTVSAVTAEEQEYQLSPPEFIGVLEASGFSAQQSMDLTVAAMPGANAEPDALTAALMKLPEDVRVAVLLAAQGGRLTREMIEALPDPLRSVLLDLLRASNGHVASVGLMHYLPELLREVIEDERELIGDHVHPLHVAPRFFLGGTENVAWPGGEFRLPAFPRISLSSLDLVRKR